MGLRTPDLHQIEQTEIPSAATSEVVLEVKKLNHSFGETIVAKDIDFQCRKGEVIALIGPNGTGKSTIGRILAGLLKEKSGEVVLFGKHCRPKGRLGKVWYIPQDLDSQLFGEDLLDELTTGAEVSPERKQAAEEILEALELMPFIKQHPSPGAGGEKGGGGRGGGGGPRSADHRTGRTDKRAGRYEYAECQPDDPQAGKDGAHHYRHYP